MINYLQVSDENEESTSDDDFIMLCSCEDAIPIIAKCVNCDEHLCVLCYYAHIRVHRSRTQDHQITFFEQKEPPPPPKKPNQKRNKRSQTNPPKKEKPLMQPVTERALKVLIALKHRKTIYIAVNFLDKL